jgi:hypothetical protein
MTQQKTSRPPQPEKITGNKLAPSEFTELNTVINHNAVDAESRLSTNIALLSSVSTRAVALSSSPIRIQSYTSANLPAVANDGTIAYDTTLQVIVYHKNSQWYRASSTTP